MASPRAFAAVAVLLLLIGTAGPLDAASSGKPVTPPAYVPYGYNPYRAHYGPVEAQHELRGLTYQPGIHGLDYGYGLGYFFGFGPPHHHRWLRSTHRR